VGGVAVVGDRHPCVVGHGGGPEELALVRGRLDDPLRVQRVVELQRERGDVPRVRHVRVGAGEQVGDRRGADVREPRLALAAEVLGEEHAFAQARARDLEAPVAAELEHGLQHERRGEDQVRARRLDPGQRAGRGRALGQPGHECAQLPRADPEALDAGRIAPALTLDRRGQVAHRAAHRDDPQLLAGREVARRELAAHGRARLLELLARGRPAVGEEALGHPDRAQRP